MTTLPKLTNVQFVERHDKFRISLFYYLVLLSLIILLLSEILSGVANRNDL
jgi:uncharacterized membrane protein